jgi:hypothetical protein
MNKIDTSKDLVKIELTMEECQQFRQFQEYYESFTTLVDSGIFTVRNGSFIIHYNSDGTIATTEIHQLTYRRRADTFVPSDKNLT